jgi:hypothetical protein
MAARLNWSGSKFSRSMVLDLPICYSAAKSAASNPSGYKGDVLDFIWETTSPLGCISNKKRIGASTGKHWGGIIYEALRSSYN